MEQSTRKLPATAAGSPAAAVVPTGNGTALYVINLCASMAPIANSDKPLAGFEQYRVYQVSRKEDGRIRYRLRLGFFSDEAEAETALACIREHYPTAFATSLCDEDQRHTRAFAGHSRPAAVTAAPAPVAKPAVQRPQPESAKPATPSAAAKPAPATPPQKPATATAKSTPATVAKPAPAATKPESSAASDTQRLPALKTDQAVEIEVEWEPAAAKAAPAVKADATAPVRKEPVAEAPASKPAPSSKATAAPASRTTTELTLASEPAAKQSPPSSAAATNQPFHVGKGVSIPTSTLSLEPEPAAAPKVSTPEPAATAPVQPSKAKQPAPRSQPPAVKNQAPARPSPPIANTAIPKPAPAAAPPKPPVVLSDDAPLPDFDSTQTIRALTAEELDDENQPKWFAVQLAVSEQPINLDTMPHLDIFSAYRLYSIATAGSGKILHHMRIGFFKEEVSAEAVRGYLKTFFANPTILRVSVAEQTRFAEAPPKAAAPEPKAKVFDIAAARERAPAREVPVVTMEVTPNPSASGRYPKPGTHASGIHKQPAAAKTAAKSATAARTAPKKTKSTSASGKHQTLQEALLAEAREVELSESAIRRLPKNSSLFAKLFGKK